MKRAGTSQQSKHYIKFSLGDITEFMSMSTFPSLIHCHVPDTDNADSCSQSVVDVGDSLGYFNVHEAKGEGGVSGSDGLGGRAECHQHNSESGGHGGRGSVHVVACKG